MKKGYLVLQDGRVFEGVRFGAERDTVGELVFTTGMCGYIETLTDPSYAGQIVLQTYPLIGNYGIIDEDYESKLIGPKGFIVREYNDKPSNFRYTKTLNELLEENEVPGLTHLDTRKLTRILRDEGAMLGLVCDSDVSHEEAMAKLAAYNAPKDLVARVSCRKKWYSRCANPRFNVVAIDCGIKYNIIRELNRYGCNVTIVPYNTSYETIMALNPDGIFLSNGPGDPKDCGPIIDEVRKLYESDIPIFAICLGHQLMALATG